jgi:acetyl esterase/lipase
MNKINLLLVCILGFCCTIFSYQQDAKNTSYELYLAKKSEFDQSMLKPFYKKFYEMHILSENEFIREIDSLKNNYIKLFEKFKTENPDFDKSVIFNESKDIHYTFDKLLIEFPYYHERFTGKSMVVNKRLENNFSDFNNEELLKNKIYLDYLKAFLYVHSSIDLQNGDYKGFDNQKLYATLNLIEKYFSKQNVADYLRFFYLNHHIDSFGIKNIDTLYHAFISRCREPAYVDKIKLFYTEEKNGRKGHLIRTYKTVDNFDLDIHLFLPEYENQHKKRPVIVFFSGGSWSEGKPDWNFYSCKSYAKKGWVGVSVEYRLADRHGTLPFEAVADAKSAIRWLRGNAKEFNIDPDRIVASGNSAGGHLALATALVDKWNEKTDNLKISCIPNVLLVNSGVFDLTEANSWIRAGLRRKKQDESLVKEISPTCFATKKLPPTLIIHGINDKNVAFSTAKEFVDKARIGGNDIVFKPLEGAGHFIWWGQFSKQVAEIRDSFLKDIGYE